MGARHRDWQPRRVSANILFLLIFAESVAG